MNASAYPDPAAWGLPDLFFSDLREGHYTRVLPGTRGLKQFAFKAMIRSPEQLAWPDRLRGPLLDDGFIVALPLPTSDGARVDLPYFD